MRTDEEIEGEILKTPFSVASHVAMSGGNSATEIGQFAIVWQLKLIIELLLDIRRISLMGAAK